MKSILKYILLSLSLASLTACSGGNAGESFTMRAQIVSTGEQLEVNVIEAPHGNSGPFFVIVSDETPLTDERGEAISMADLSVGDIIDVDYGGQVMMSYPPKISAQRVRIISRAK